MKTTSINDFLKEKVLGKGSFGSVYLVRRKADNKIYALKSVTMEKLNKKEQENSVNEVRILASINHPNVIGYKEAFWDDDGSSLNIVMEYADDGDLQTKIIKMRKEGGFFTESLIWSYSIQMIEGLKALHDKKIMHRDLKSANIFLVKDKHQCKIGDMNVSKVIKEKVLRTQTGTPYYASPEVWKDMPYSYKSDLWSIGCVIYELCALRPPFKGKDLDELFENVCKGKPERISYVYSEDLWKMILMLLQVDVNKRVDCNKFLNSKLIKKKIKEMKKNTLLGLDKINFDKNLEEQDSTLLETIKFNNISEIKDQLPTKKNYDNDDSTKKNNNNNNTNNNKKTNIVHKTKSSMGGIGGGVSALGNKLKILGGAPRISQGEPADRNIELKLKEIKKEKDKVKKELDKHLEYEKIKVYLHKNQEKIKMKEKQNEKEKEKIKEKEKEKLILKNKGKIRYDIQLKDSSTVNNDKSHITTTSDKNDLTQKRVANANVNNYINVNKNYRKVLRHNNTEIYTNKKELNHMTTENDNMNMNKIPILKIHHRPEMDLNLRNQNTNFAKMKSRLRTTENTSNGKTDRNNLTDLYSPKHEVIPINRSRMSEKGRDSENERAITPINYDSKILNNKLTHLISPKYKKIDVQKSLGSFSSGNKKKYNFLGNNLKNNFKYTNNNNNTINNNESKKDNLDNKENNNEENKDNKEINDKNKYKDKESSEITNIDNKNYDCNDKNNIYIPNGENKSNSLTKKNLFEQNKVNVAKERPLSAVPAIKRNQSTQDNLSVFNSKNSNNYRKIKRLNTSSTRCNNLNNLNKNNNTYNNNRSINSVSNNNHNNTSIPIDKMNGSSPCKVNHERTLTLGVNEKKFNKIKYPIINSIYHNTSDYGLKNLKKLKTRPFSNNENNSNNKTNLTTNNIIINRSNLSNKIPTNKINRIPNSTNKSKNSITNLSHKRIHRANREYTETEIIMMVNPLDDIKKVGSYENKKNLNISTNNNLINSPNAFLHQIKPITTSGYDSNNNTNGNIGIGNNNININHRLNNYYSPKINNAQIFNNFYSINSVGTTNIPMKKKSKITKIAPKSKDKPKSSVNYVQSKLKRVLHPNNNKPITLETNTGTNHPQKKSKKKPNRKPSMDVPSSKKPESEIPPVQKSLNNTTNCIDYLNFSDIDTGICKLNSSFAEDIFSPNNNAAEEGNKNKIVSNRYNNIETSSSDLKISDQKNLDIIRKEKEPPSVNHSTEDILKTPSTICNYYDKSNGSTAKKYFDDNKNKNKESSEDKYYHMNKKDQDDLSQKKINWRLKDSIKIAKTKSTNLNYNKTQIHNQNLNQKNINCIVIKSKNLNKKYFNDKFIINNNNKNDINNNNSNSNKFIKVQKKSNLKKKKDKDKEKEKGNENDINNNTNNRKHSMTKNESEIPIKNNLMENYLKNTVVQRRHSFTMSSNKKNSGSESKKSIPKENLTRTLINYYKSSNNISNSNMTYNNNYNTTNNINNKTNNTTTTTTLNKKLNLTNNNPNLINIIKAINGTFITFNNTKTNNTVGEILGNNNNNNNTTNNNNKHYYSGSGGGKTFSHKREGGGTIQKSSLGKCKKNRQQSQQKPIMLCYDQNVYDSYFVTPKNDSRIIKGKALTSNKSTKINMSNTSGQPMINSNIGSSDINNNNIIINNKNLFAVNTILNSIKTKSFNTNSTGNTKKNNNNNNNNNYNQSQSSNKTGKTSTSSQNKIKVNLAKHVKSSSVLTKPGRNCLNIGIASVNNNNLNNNNNNNINNNNNNNSNNNNKILNSVGKEKSQILYNLINFSGGEKVKSPPKNKNSNPLKISKTLTEQNIINRIQATPKYYKIPKSGACYSTLNKNVYIGSNEKENYNLNELMKQNTSGLKDKFRENNINNFIKPKTQSDFKSNKYFIGNDFLKVNGNNDYGTDKNVKQKLLDRMNKVSSKANWQYLYRGNCCDKKKVLMENLSEIMKSPDKENGTNLFYKNNTIISNDSDSENDTKNEKQ